MRTTWTVLLWESLYASGSPQVIVSLIRWFEQRHLSIVKCASPDWRRDSKFGPTLDLSDTRENTNDRSSQRVVEWRRLSRFQPDFWVPTLQSTPEDSFSLTGWDEVRQLSQRLPFDV